MKTKLTLLLVLALHSASAQLPSLNPKAAAQARSGMSQSIQKPATGPSTNGFQKAPMPRPTIGSSYVSPPAKTAGAVKPKIEVKKPLPAAAIPGFSNADAIREAGNIANDLRSLDSLRGSAVGNTAAEFGLPGTDSGGHDASRRDQFANSPLGGLRPGASGGDEWMPGGIAGGGRNKSASQHFGSDSLSTPSFGSIRSGLASDGPATRSSGDARQHTDTSAEGTRSTTRETHSDGTTTAKTVIVGPDGSQQIFAEQRADKDGDGVAESIVGRHIEHRRSDGSSTSQETSRNPDGTYTTTERSTTPGASTDYSRSTSRSAPAAMPLPRIRTDRNVDPDATPRGGQQFTSPGHKGEEPAIIRARKRPGNQVRPDNSENATTGHTPRIISQGPGTVVNPGTVDMPSASGGSAMNGARMQDGGRLVNPGKDPR